MRIIKDWSQIVLVGVVLVLLASNILLLIQNTELKKAVEQTKLFVTEEGYVFSDLKIKGLDGQEDVVNLSDGKLKTLLLVFSTSCNYCRQQYPYWKKLTENLDAAQWRVFAVTSEDNYDKIRNHLEENKLNSIKVGSVSQEDMRKTRMLYTPMTLVVDPNGEVKRVWPGLWKKDFELPQ